MAKIPDKIVSNIKSLVQIAANNNIGIKKAVIFGSYASGSAGEYSDIDIALVSDDFSGIRLDDNLKLMNIVLAVDHRIETHPFRPEDFTPENLFVKEILDKGVSII